MHEKRRQPRYNSLPLREVFAGAHWPKLLLWSVLPCLIGLSTACTRPLAYPTELPLLPQPATEKYYLFNQVSKDAQGREQHDCLLLTQSPTAQGQSAAFFISRWNDADSTYQLGMQARPEATWSKPGRWPLLARLEGDSSRADWRVFLNRQSFWLDGQFQGPNAGKVAMRAVFPRRDSLATAQVHARPEVYALHTGSGRMRDGKGVSVETQFQGAVFCDAAGLLQDPAIQAVYWIQIAFANGGQRALLMTLDQAQGLSKVADFTFRSENGWSALGHASARTYVKDPWTSPHSKKQYFLNLHFSGPHIRYMIRARAAAQEVQAGKRSFWMGAVEMAMHENAEAVGVGNMYVFVR